MIIKLRIIEEIFILFRVLLKGYSELSKIIILTCLVALFELLSVGFLIPFLKILSSPVEILEKWNFFLYLNIKTTDQLIRICVLFFIFVLIISGFLRFFLMLIITKLTFSTGLLISTKIFSNVINQKYEYHLINNSSTLIDAISTKTIIIRPIITATETIMIINIIIITLSLSK
jgi:hypothetical protein